MAHVKKYPLHVWNELVHHQEIISVLPE